MLSRSVNVRCNVEILLKKMRLINKLTIWNFSLFANFCTVQLQPLEYSMFLFISRQMNGIFFWKSQQLLASYWESQCYYSNKHETSLLMQNCVLRFNKYQFLWLNWLRKTNKTSIFLSGYLLSREIVQGIFHSFEGPLSKARIVAFSCLNECTHCTVTFYSFSTPFSG